AKGKLGYMALESVMGKDVDTRADIFSAGVVIWEMLAMRRLFRGDTDIELINAIRDCDHIEPPSQYNADCPLELDEVVVKALAKHRDGRWSSAGEMLEILSELRRYYPATARDVRAWVQRLWQDIAPAQLPRLDTDGESTMVRLSTDDLFEGERQLGVGSDAATYDDLIEDEGEREPSPGRAKFHDADTLVSTFSPRKR